MGVTEAVRVRPLLLEPKVLFERVAVVRFPPKEPMVRLPPKVPAL